MKKIKNQKEYALRCGYDVLGIFSTPADAFEAIRQDEYTEVTQTVCGYEEFTPTADKFTLGAPIYVHTVAHEENFSDRTIHVKERDDVYVINIFDYK